MKKLVFTLIGLLALVLVGCSSGTEINPSGTNALNQKAPGSGIQKSTRTAKKAKKEIEALVKEGDFEAAQELINVYTLDLTEETSPDDHNNMMAYLVPVSTLAQVKKDLESDKSERTMACEIRIFEYLDEVISSEAADEVLIGHAKELEEKANELYTEISEEIGLERTIYQ